MTKAVAKAKETKVVQVQEAETAVVVTRPVTIIAAEINSIKEQTQKMVLYNSIEIGRRLIEAKAAVPHGEWGNWLKDSVDISQSTANNLMKIFEEYGSDQLSLFGDNAKSQALGNLSYTQAVALLAVPADDREQFVEENNPSELSTRQLQSLIKEKQDLEQRLKETEIKANQISQEREQDKSKYDEWARTTAEEKEKQTQEVERLQKQLADVAANDSDEDAEQLRKDLKNAENKLKETQAKAKQLEEQLKAKPIEVPVKEIVEKVPEAVQQELEQLRKQITLSNNKPVLKFSLCFENLVKGFQELLDAWGEIPDPEEKEKYKKATQGLLGKMSERL